MTLLLEAFADGKAQLEACADQLDELEQFAQTFLITIEGQEPTIPNDLISDMNGIAAKFAGLASFLGEKTNSVTAADDFFRKRKLPKRAVDPLLYKLMAYCQVGMMGDPELGAAFR